MITEEFITAVRPVIAWARAKYDPITGTYSNGWKRQGWAVNRAFSTDTRHVSWSPSGDLEAAIYRQAGRRGLFNLSEFRVTSTQQAIDILAALGVLPARFSSQWREGRDVALEAVATAVLLPDLEPVPEFVDGYHVGQRSHA